MSNLSKKIPPWKALILGSLFTFPFAAAGLWLAFQQMPSLSAKPVNPGPGVAALLILMGNGYLSAGHALGLGYKHQNMWVGFLAISIWSGFLLAVFNVWVLVGGVMIAVGFSHGRAQRWRVENGAMPEGKVAFLAYSARTYLMLPVVATLMALFFY